MLALDRVEVQTILNHSLKKWNPIQSTESIVIPAMEQIGSDWEDGEIALSQIFMAGRICEEIVDKILPPADPSRKDQPKMGIAVLQDQHILGKRMVYSVLRASGFELKDLGSGLSADELIEAVYDNNLEVLLISALMLNAALQVKKVTQRFQEDNKQIIVVVGEPPSSSILSYGRRSVPMPWAGMPRMRQPWSTK